MQDLEWVRQAQETDGTYMFSGRLLVTRGAKAILSDQEIHLIVTDLKQFVSENNGIDYLVVYDHKRTQEKLFFIDQLNKEMIASGEFKQEYNYATLLLSSEY